jgi:hypothetical protein
VAKMIDLLKGVKKIINDEIGAAGTLSSVNKVTMYPERNPVGFPFITVLPVAEAPLEYYSGGKYRSLKTVSIQIYAHKADSKRAYRQALGLLDKATDLFEVETDDWLIPHIDTDIDQAIDTQVMEAVSSNQSVPYRNGFIQISSFDLGIEVEDDLHPDVGGTSASTQIEADAKTVVDTITSTIKGYKTGAEDFFSHIDSYKSFTVPPTVTYPLIFVGIENENREHAHPGLDVVSRSISIYGIHKMTQGNDALERNLLLMEYIRQIIFANKDFGGISINTLYEGTAYRQSHSGRNMLLGSNVNLTIDTIDQLRA